MNTITWVNDLGEFVTSEVYARFIDEDGVEWAVVKYWRSAEPYLIRVPYA